MPRSWTWERVVNYSPVRRNDLPWLEDLRENNDRYFVLRTTRSFLRAIILRNLEHGKHFSATEAVYQDR